MEVEEEESSLKDDRKAWKLVIRQRISELMEGKNFAQNPRHVHH
jgi:5-formyltetrahydrofolate cyclo-ligase